jgi:hypothetical protein
MVQRQYGKRHSKGVGAHPDRPLSGRAVVDLSALVPQSGSLFVCRASEVRSQ